MDVINYNFSDLEKYHHNFSYCKLAITQDLLVGNVFTYLLKMPPVHSDKVPRLPRLVSLVPFVTHSHCWKFSQFNE
jgi:hypothetical protein